MKEDTVNLIGKVLDEHPNAERDAIHIAVLPCITGDVLLSGELVKVGEDGLAYGVKKKKDAIGIIDPFLIHAIGKGQKCFIFLFPGTITSLKHHWVHPSLPEGIEHKPIGNKVANALNKEHEEWLREFASRNEIVYDRLIKEVSSQGRVHAGTTFYGPEGEEYDEFWYHYECLTGLKFNDKHRANVEWSCSC